MDNLKFGRTKKIGNLNFKYLKIKEISELETTSPPSVFVGSKLKYPFMNVGVLSPLEKKENSWLYDAEEYWAKNNFKIKDVLKLRNNLLNSRFKSRATDVRFGNKFLDVTKLIGIASKPVDLEIKLKNKIKINNERDKILKPRRFSASLKNARITSNVKVSEKVDKILNDDLKANQSISYLYKNNFNEYFLNKILSVGVLGLKKNKKLVPTRWAITAVDDALAKELLKQVQNYKLIETYQLLFSEFMGNQYLILFLPRFGLMNYLKFIFRTPAGIKVMSLKHPLIQKDFTDEKLMLLILQEDIMQQNFPF